MPRSGGDEVSRSVLGCVLLLAALGSAARVQAETTAPVREVTLVAPTEHAFAAGKLANWLNEQAGKAPRLVTPKDWQRGHGLSVLIGTPTDSPVLADVARQEEIVVHHLEHAPNPFIAATFSPAFSAARVLPMNTFGPTGAWLSSTMASRAPEAFSTLSANIVAADLANSSFPSGTTMV